MLFTATAGFTPRSARGSDGPSATARSGEMGAAPPASARFRDRKSTRLNSSHLVISYAVFCLKKKKRTNSNLHHLNLFYYTHYYATDVIFHVFHHRVPPSA